MDGTKGLIIATVAVAASVSFVEQMEGKRPVTFRTYLGDWFLGIFLTGIAMVDERLARNFCLLIILAILLKDGGNLFSFAGQASSTKPAAGPNPHAQGTTGKSQASAG